MDIGQSIEVIIGAAGLTVGIMYVIGGLIVNLHLSGYGVTEYQVLRIKYLVVGLTYFTNFIAILFLAVIPAVFLVTVAWVWQQIFFIVSLLASICLLALWTRSRSRAFLLTRRLWLLLGWVILGALSSIFPLVAILKVGLVLSLGGSLNFESGGLLVEAFLAGILSFVGQTYYYAQHLYGKRNTFFGAADPIGLGIPVSVQLAGPKEQMALLTQIGIPLHKPEVTEPVLLLDETDTHYIIGLGQPTRPQAVEVAKDMVKVIKYG